MNFQNTNGKNISNLFGIGRILLIVKADQRSAPTIIKKTIHSIKKSELRMIHELLINGSS